METKVVATDSFAHGAKMYRAGDPVEVSPGELADLRKAGLVEDKTNKAQTGVTDSQDDLLGGEKMDEAPKNKMAPAPANKGKK